MLHGAFDPTGVSTVNVAGESLYYVAATGRGVQLLRSADIKHWQPAGNVFEQPAPGWTLQYMPGTRGIWTPAREPMIGYAVARESFAFRSLARKPRMHDGRYAAILGDKLSCVSLALRPHEV